jgi:hypothetical protein
MKDSRFAQFNRPAVAVVAAGFDSLMFLSGNTKTFSQRLKLTGRSRDIF